MLNSVTFVYRVAVTAKASCELVSPLFYKVSNCLFSIWGVSAQ